jgi:hypothetical protein
MAIQDLTPFGTAPKFYEGLLGAEETAALQKRAQIQGLLGAGLALAKGMSAYGPPRSALQNILGSVAGGFESAGGAYQQGLQNFQTQQQIQQAQLQREQLKLQRDQQLAQADAVKQLLLDPTIASDPAAVAYIRANPVEAVKEISQRRMRESELAKLRQARTSVEPQASGPTSELEAQIQNLVDRGRIEASMGKASEAKAFYEAANNLRKEQGNVAASQFDFTALESQVSANLKPAVQNLAKLAQSRAITGEQVLAGIQQIQAADRESAKANLLGNVAAADYAKTQFGTADITKLSQPQRDNALRYAEAPNEIERAKLFNDGIRLKYETGQGGIVPAAKTSFFNQNQPPVTSQTAPLATNVPVATTPNVPVTTAPAAVTTPRVATAPKPAQAQTIPVETKGIIPLVEKSDITPKKRDEIKALQPATIALANYTLDNISQQKKAAEELLNNKNYIKAITSSNLLGGYITESLANRPGYATFDANNLLKNLQNRSFITEIQRMRAASPTGGAVGSVTEKEMEGLSNIGAALKLGMSEKELTAQLKKYITNADRALKTIPSEYSRTYRYQGEFDQYLNPNASPTAPASAPASNVRKYNMETGRIE